MTPRTRSFFCGPRCSRPVRPPRWGPIRAHCAAFDSPSCGRSQACVCVCCLFVRGPPRPRFDPFYRGSRAEEVTGKASATDKQRQGHPTRGQHFRHKKTGTLQRMAQCAPYVARGARATNARARSRVVDALARARARWRPARRSGADLWSHSIRLVRYAIFHIIGVFDLINSTSDVRSHAARACVGLITRLTLRVCVCVFCFGGRLRRRSLDNRRSGSRLERPRC